MTGAATYSVREALRDGRAVVIHAIRPENRSAMVSAVGRVSAQSLYRRFFDVKRGFTEKETDFFVNVDFVTHVALVAVADEGGQGTIIGAGRYIVSQPGKAELAFAIIDQYQGLGIGTALLRNLVLMGMSASTSAAKKAHEPKPIDSLLDMPCDQEKIIRRAFEYNLGSVSWAFSFVIHDTVTNIPIDAQSEDQFRGCTLQIRSRTLEPRPATCRSRVAPI
jgi:hypothetical protein